jgi:NTP pyrophosphatase (non-canonical NTP hydrolase)
MGYLSCDCPDLKKLLNEVARERERQDAKWGEQNHDPMDWYSILGEEFGEMYDFKKKNFKKATPEQLAHYREELIQVAAVAVAMVECLDRAKWSK